MTKDWKIFLRSVRGQFTLLGITYAGALVLAIGAVCTRSLLFERFVREKHPPLPSALRSVAEDFSSGRTHGKRFESLSSAELDALYGAWISEFVADPHARLAMALWKHHGEETMNRLRGTLVAGNRKQQMRALDLLAFQARGELRPVVAELSRYALDRARRRGDDELRFKAAGILANSLSE